MQHDSFDRNHAPKTRSIVRTTKIPRLKFLSSSGRLVQLTHSGYPNHDQRGALGSATTHSYSQAHPTRHPTCPSYSSSTNVSPFTHTKTTSPPLQAVDSKRKTKLRKRTGFNKKSMNKFIQDFTVSITCLCYVHNTCYRTRIYLCSFFFFSFVLDIKFQILVSHGQNI